MRIAGTILILLGALLIAAAFGSGIAAPGGQTVNLGLMADREVLAGLGGALIVAGSVLFGSGAIVAQMKGGRETATSPAKPFAPDRTDYPLPPAPVSFVAPKDLDGPSWKDTRR